MGVADCGHVHGGQWRGTGEEHEAWAVSLQRVAGRLATPLGHIKKDEDIPGEALQGSKPSLKAKGLSFFTDIWSCSEPASETEFRWRGCLTGQNTANPCL